MVRVSYDQKPFRRSLIRRGAPEIVPSPSRDTQCGRAILEEHPDTPGSLGIAISEAVEDAAGRDDTSYSLGSVLNHVLLHQTIIGQEALAQMEQAGAFPDVVVGCVGGGSNFAGLAFPFIREKIAGRDIDVLACEPAACPTLTRGLFAYDFGDTSKLTPLVAMHTLGTTSCRRRSTPGGLRYHGVAPLISQLVKDDLVRAEAYLQNDVFASAVLFAGSEGIIPAPESSHAIHGALEARGRPTRRGGAHDPLQPLRPRHFDMAAYDNYFAGKLVGRRARRGGDAARAASDRGAADACVVPARAGSGRRGRRARRCVAPRRRRAARSTRGRGTTRRCRRSCRCSAGRPARTRKPPRNRPSR
jgi:tryptophan synthase beta chain